MNSDNLRHPEEAEGRLEGRRFAGLGLHLGSVRRRFTRSLDLLSLLACVLIWGTTWFVIKLQLGSVDPTASVVYRFALAGGVLVIVNRLRRAPATLTLRQHLYTAGQGICVFALGYRLVYAAEAHAPSALVAVVWASLALINLVVFAVLYRQVSPWPVWVGAVLGTLGVAALSVGQILSSPVGSDLMLGVGLALASVGINAVGNLCTREGQALGTDITLSTGAAMLYGTGALVLYGLVTRVNFAAPLTLAYWGPLFYLSLLGSVAAFLLYYTLASRRGFTLASYVGAMTPPVAMVVSSLFEHVEWGAAAFVGIGLILGGQFLVLRFSGAHK